MFKTIFMGYIETYIYDFIYLYQVLFLWYNEMI